MKRLLLRIIAGANLGYGTGVLIKHYYIGPIGSGLWVSVGNIVAGVLLIGILYFIKKREGLDQYESS
ncbi:hypothetical protein LCGC14_1128340 [marine sediment metagenome]|uniref:Uncharacterized protein n=1 Tax=marine sediment metagenome TaxID=412755 RepID=A0A0F9M204_9ZZZZ